MADDIVTRLGAVEVLSPANERVRLGETWAGRPVLLAMIRHFG